MTASYAPGTTASCGPAEVVGPLVLEVHQDNARAITAYGRLGFVATGQRRPYPLGPDRDEIVMARPAAPS